VEFMGGIGPVELIIVALSGLFTLAIPVAIVVLLVVLVRRANQAPRPPAGWGPDPRAVLADRLARGEITRDEFDTAMRALGIPTGPGPGGPA
jgi:uncharacterized membrane protein